VDIFIREISPLISAQNVSGATVECTQLFYRLNNKQNTKRHCFLKVAFITFPVGSQPPNMATGRCLRLVLGHSTARTTAQKRTIANTVQRQHSIVRWAQKIAERSYIRRSGGARLLVKPLTRCPVVCTQV
jgi:hypothetical protein